MVFIQTGTLSAMLNAICVPLFENQNTMLASAFCSPLFTTAAPEGFQSNMCPLLWHVKK